MKKYILLFLGLSLFLSCRQEVTEPDKFLELQNLLNGGFKAILVRENTTIVFQEGASSQIIPGYSQYRLEFSGKLGENPTVKLKEYTGENFVGTWNLTKYGIDGFKLTLSNLTPPPYGTNGIIEFEIILFDTSTIDLKNLSSSPKTGDTINQYKLQKL